MTGPRRERPEDPADPGRGSAPGPSEEQSPAAVPSTDVLDTPAAGPASIRGGALRGAAFVVGLLLTLASAPLLVRHLGPVDFGRYVLVTAVLILFAGLTDAGLGVIAQREYVVERGATRDALMRNLLGLRIVTTALSVVLAAAFTAIAGYGDVLVVGALIAGFGALTASVQGVMAVALTGHLQFGRATLVELLRAVVAVGLVIGLVLADASLLPFFAVTIPAGLAALALTAWLVRGLIPLRPAFDVRRWWELIKDTIPYAAATAINVAYFRISIALMALVATELETGFFATSYRILEVILGVPPLLVSAVFPVLARAARDDEARLAYVVQRVFEVSVILGVWFALSVELGAEFMVDVVAGEGFGPSVPVLRIQAIALVAAFLSVGCGFPLLSLRRHRALLVANATALAASVAGTLLLAPRYGAEGAAIATVAAEVALGVTTTVLLMRARASLRLSFAIVPPVLLALAAGGAVVLIPGLPDIAAVAAGTALYFGVLAVLRRIPPELLDAARRRSPGPATADPGTPA